MDDDNNSRPARDGEGGRPYYYEPDFGPLQPRAIPHSNQPAHRTTRSQPLGPTSRGLRSNPAVNHGSLPLAPRGQIVRQPVARGGAFGPTDKPDDANPLSPPHLPAEVVTAETQPPEAPIAEAAANANAETPPGEIASGVPATQAVKGDKQLIADRGLLLDLDDLERAAEIPDDPIFGPLEPGIVALLVGEAGIGKSTILIYILVAIAAGVKFAGITPPRPQPVVFFSPEDGAKQIGRRIKAACAELGADRELVKRNLKVVSDAEFFTLFEQDENGPRLSKNGQRVVAAAKNHGARLVALDPLVELHAASENDNGQMHAVFGKTRGLAREISCAFLIGHHTTKEKGTARGASSITGTVRFSMTAEQLGKTEADTYAKQGKEQTDLFKLEMSKFSYGRREPGFRVFERVCVDFGGYSAPALRELKR